MTNSETKNFSQNVSSSYHLRGECSNECKKDSLNVPKLRFKGYNDEWKHYRLKDIVQIYDGTHQTPNYIDDGIKFVSVENINNLDKTNKYISREDYEKDFKIKPEINDILMTRIGDIGTPAIINTNERYAYYVSLALLKSNYAILSPKFLIQRISSEQFQHELWKRTLHVAFPKKINKNEIGECNVFIPPLPEQEKIASFLTLIDKKIEKQKELIELLKKYKRGLLSQIFSQKLRFKDKNGNNYPDWEEKTLNNIFDIVTDFVAAGSFADLRKNVQYNEKPDFAQLVRTIDLKNNFKNKDFVFISESAYKYLWRVNLNEDALILPNIGANIGEVYYIYSFKLPYKNNVLGPNAILLKSSNNNLYYLYSRCLTDNFRKQLLLQVGASGQPKFNKTDLKKIKIKISININEQNKISDFLSKFDDKIQQEKCILNYLQTYKKGLLQQMFI